MKRSILLKRKRKVTMIRRRKAWNIPNQILMRIFKKLRRKANKEAKRRKKALCGPTPKKSK